MVAFSFMIINIGCNQHLPPVSFWTVSLLAIAFVSLPLLTPFTDLVFKVMKLVTLQKKNKLGSAQIMFESAFFERKGLLQVVTKGKVELRKIKN